MNVIETGNCLDVMRRWVAEGVKVQTIVTSPPYYGLRDYGVEGQFGLEKTPQEYVDNLVSVFRVSRDLLADDGTLWLNLGDSYAGSWGARGRGQDTNAARPDLESKFGTAAPNRNGFAPWGVRPKDRMMLPARTALALQADGWYLRDEIVWHKPRTTPNPVKDRTVAAHEMMYMLSKRPRYYFDWAAIEEPAKYPGLVRKRGKAFRTHGSKKAEMLSDATQEEVSNKDGVTFTVRDTRRKRSVWSVSPAPYKEAHFATFPPDLIEPCILAGSRLGDTVLDPFGGSGTTGMVAAKHGRSYRLIELNTAYVELMRKRIPTTLADLL